MINPEIFQAGEIVYHLAHVLSFAELQGQLAPVREYLSDCISCRLYAEEQGFEPHMEQIQATSEEFRYSRHLLTAQETQQWLEHWRLTEDDLSDYLVLSHWRRRFDAELPTIRKDYGPSRDQIHSALWPEIALGGRLRELVLPLARRVAAVPEAGGAELPSAVREVASRTLTEQREQADHGLDFWLEQIPRSSEWLQTLVAMEAHYLLACGKIVTPEQSLIETQNRRLALVRLVVESVLFPAAGAAHEAFLCVTEDGESLESVATRAGGQVVVSDFLLGEIPEPWQQRFLSAAPGEVLQPLEGEQGFYIHRVRKKTEPDLSDPEIRRIVEERLLSRFFDSLVEERIRWLLPLE